MYMNKNYSFLENFENNPKINPKDQDVDKVVKENIEKSKKLIKKKIDELIDNIKKTKYDNSTIEKSCDSIIKSIKLSIDKNIVKKLSEDKNIDSISEQIGKNINYKLNSSENTKKIVDKIQSNISNFIKNSINLEKSKIEGNLNEENKEIIKDEIKTYIANNLGSDKLNKDILGLVKRIKKKIKDKSVNDILKNNSEVNKKDVKKGVKTKMLNVDNIILNNVRKSLSDVDMEMVTANITKQFDDKPINKSKDKLIEIQKKQLISKELIEKFNENKSEFIYKIGTHVMRTNTDDLSKLVSQIVKANNITDEKKIKMVTQKVIKDVIIIGVFSSFDKFFNICKSKIVKKVDSFEKFSNNFKLEVNDKLNYKYNEVLPFKIKNSKKNIVKSFNFDLNSYGSI